MQIVIDISKRLYTDIKDSWSITLGSKNTDKIIKAIKNGTPLPKGHGRLIDYSWVVDNVIKKLGIKDERYLLEAEKALMSIIEIAPTIIEADRGE